MKICGYDAGHMTMIAVMSIYGKNPLKNLYRIRPADFQENWYEASGSSAHYSLFK